MNFSARIKKTQNLIEEKGYKALLIEEPLNILYLTGLDISMGQLLIDTSSASILVDSRYYEECKKLGTIDVVATTKTALVEALTKKSIKSVTVDGATMTYNSFIALEKKLSSKDITLVAADSPLKELRSIKDAEEIKSLRNSAALAAQGWDYACSILKEGITEKAVATEMEIFWKKNGGEAPSFESNISFGANSALPHHRAGTSKLTKNSVILMDIGVTVENYASDMTRVAFFGDPSTEITKIHDIVQRAQKAALELCRPGTDLGTLDNAARNIISAEGYGEYFSHGLGHGVGLNVHETPVVTHKDPWCDIKLQEGMVITVEPGIYLPDIGGVRIEDTIVITKDGYESLTQRPTEAIVIEV
ncbi:MAG: aminopeptidase P family protein [Waddliaceae bacterium]|jgi:Xaa-Pro aminopeptidase|nr:aminopeptidase P family protein [Waddliaceae bacterium]MBT3579342.1 aminopeptidase P family protein [Waddliaceae bacterium]MBT4444832.1 aminopeptidase P family protein [Waddliaceae bacterium]MBT6928032.1 aminopeptidase P family protein [Waddliaceae bacterium]MBT7264292.1 aminopeptidase P family protein [Waddliaceae bacterium]